MTLPAQRRRVPTPQSWWQFPWHQRWFPWQTFRRRWHRSGTSWSQNEHWPLPPRTMKERTSVIFVETSFLTETLVFFNTILPGSGKPRPPASLCRQRPAWSSPPSVVDCWKGRTPWDGSRPRTSWWQPSQQGPPFQTWEWREAPEGTLGPSRL